MIKLENENVTKGTVLSVTVTKGTVLSVTELFAKGLSG